MTHLIVARPFPYAADGLTTVMVQQGQVIDVDPNLARGLVAEGLCLAEADPAPAAGTQGGDSGGEAKAHMEENGAGDAPDQAEHAGEPDAEQPIVAEAPEAPAEHHAPRRRTARK